MTRSKTLQPTHTKTNMHTYTNSSHTNTLKEHEIQTNRPDYDAGKRVLKTKPFDSLVATHLAGAQAKLRSPPVAQIILQIFDASTSCNQKVARHQKIAPYIYMCVYIYIHISTYIYI